MAFSADQQSCRRHTDQGTLYLPESVSSPRVSDGNQNKCYVGTSAKSTEYFRALAKKKKRTNAQEQTVPISQMDCVNIVRAGRDRVKCISFTTASTLFAAGRKHDKPTVAPRAREGLDEFL